MTRYSFSSIGVCLLLIAVSIPSSAWAQTTFVPENHKGAYLAAGYVVTENPNLHGLLFGFQVWELLELSGSALRTNPQLLQGATSVTANVNLYALRAKNSSQPIGIVFSAGIDLSGGLVELEVLRLGGGMYFHIRPSNKTIIQPSVSLAHNSALNRDGESLGVSMGDGLGLFVSVAERAGVSFESRPLPTRDLILRRSGCQQVGWN